MSKLEILREKDDLLTEKFIQAGYRHEVLRKLNLIRMHLRVISVADIATVNGRRISTAAWKVLEGNGPREEI